MNAIELQLLANHIALSHIKDNVDLNTGIAKLATDRDLSRLHIQGLVTAVNHATNDLLRKQAADKTYTFSVAELDKVLDLLAPRDTDGVSLSKVASLFSTAGQPLSQRHRPYIDKLAEAGCKQSAEQNIARATSVIKKLKNKTGTASRIVEAEKTATLVRLGEQLDALTQEMKNYLTASYSMKDLYKCAALALPEAPQTVVVVMNAVSEKLTKLGHPFTGVLATAKELQKETFKRNGVTVPAPEVSVVNGRAPIVKMVQEIHKTISGVTALDLLTHELASLSSCITTSERVLRDNRDVNEYLLNELETAHRKFDVSPDITVDKLASILTPVKNFVAGTRALGKGLRAAIPMRAVARAIPGAASLSAMSAGLTAGQAVANKAKQGIAFSRGKGDSSLNTLT